MLIQLRTLVKEIRTYVKNNMSNYCLEEKIIKSTMYTSVVFQKFGIDQRGLIDMCDLKNVVFIKSWTGHKVKRLGWPAAKK
jgi:hypothetical protein